MWRVSLSNVLPSILPYLSADATLVCLIKPQFEAGRKNLNKNGVVKSPKIHREVIDGIISFSSAMFGTAGLTYSPVARKDGNIEYLLHLRKNCDSVAVDTAKIVADAAKNVIYDK